jgi:hypothetical protein
MGRRLVATSLGFLKDLVQVLATKLVCYKNNVGFTKPSNKFLLMLRYWLAGFVLVTGL